MKQPDLVAKVVTAPEFKAAAIPSNVLLQLAEALNSGARPSEYNKELAKQIFGFASSGRLDERELRRVGVALLRNKEEKDVLALVERHLLERPEWQNNAGLLQLRGDAYIGLAKRCKNSVRNPDLPHPTRQRIWKQFHEFLELAESDLRRAESASSDAGLTDIIRANLAYLEKYKAEHRQAKRRRRIE